MLLDEDPATAKLSRTLSTRQTHHKETLASHSSADHASQIVQLDTQKFHIAKSASDFEIESEKPKLKLEGLKSKLAELEMQGAKGGEGECGKRESKDETLLKLKVYRTLGIEIKSDEAGKYNKAVTWNSQKGDVHVVNVDPKFSGPFYANYFLQMI